MKRRRAAWLLFLLLLFSICGETDRKAPPGPRSQPKAMGTVSGGEGVRSDDGEAVSGGMEAEISSELSAFIRMDEQKRASMVTALYAVPMGEGLRSAEEAGAADATGAGSAETGPADAAETAADVFAAETGSADTKETAETAVTAESDGAEPETAERPLYALGDNPDKQVLLFGSERQRFSSGEEAASHMEQVEVPVWELDGAGHRTAGTMWVQVHAALAEDTREIFTEIYEDPEQFPIESLGGFVWRDRNPSSEHCSGSAIDINPDQNFQVRDGNAMTGSYWKPGQDPRSITPEGSVVRAFADHGWSWGGDAWAGYSDQATGYHDYMHFSYRGR